MLLATTSNSSPEHLPGQRDHVLHADSRQGGKKTQTQPSLQGECIVLTPGSLPVLCYMDSGGMGSLGLKVSNPTTKNSLSPSDLLQYLHSLIMTLNSGAHPNAVLYTRARDKQLQMPTLINQTSI